MTGRVAVSEWEPWRESAFAEFFLLHRKPASSSFRPEDRNHERLTCPHCCDILILVSRLQWFSAVGMRQLCDELFWMPERL